MPTIPSVCRIGPQISREHMANELDLFVASGVFARRPVLPSNPYNSGGTGFFHAFYIWMLVRLLKPAHIIESGAFQGLGTWIIRQAAPKAQIVVLSPRMPGVYVDRQPSTRYFSGSRWLDFSQITWPCLKFNKSRTLVFIDDHQSGYRRILEASARGFKVRVAYAIPTGTADPIRTRGRHPSG